MYGHNAGHLRTELAGLMRHHRIQQRLGGPGNHTVPETTTLDEREVLGKQIARYRQAVLQWCLQATRATTRQIDADSTDGRTHGPAEELRHRLMVAVGASSSALPTLRELTTEQTFPIVESWRQAARAATLGEHDFGAGLTYGHLTDEQCRTVLKDVSEITRGLVVLDRRYEGIPNWKRLKDQDRLRISAEACATYASSGKQDYQVDWQGWRPPIPAIDGPTPPGIGGLLQAEHNLLVYLKQFPDAHGLRLILDSQRIVSHEVANKVRPSQPALAKKWDARAITFSALLRETRNIRGMLGNGGPAAAQGAIAATRAQTLQTSELNNRTAVHLIAQMFTHVDNKLSDIIEHGVSARLYLRRVKLPYISNRSIGLVQQQRVRYAPLNSSEQPELIRLVRTRLRPPLERPRAPDGAGRSRTEFEAAITHRPQRRSGGPSVSL